MEGESRYTMQIPYGYDRISGHAPAVIRGQVDLATEMVGVQIVHAPGYDLMDVVQVVSGTGASHLSQESLAHYIQLGKFPSCLILGRPILFCGTVLRKQGVAEFLVPALFIDPKTKGASGYWMHFNKPFGERDIPIAVALPKSGGSFH